jgi:transcriptional regulator GlxA family with amidase domain
MAVSAEKNGMTIAPLGDKRHASQGALPHSLQICTAGASAKISPVQLRQRTRGGLPPGALRRVRDYVDAHLGENISISVLASAAGLSMYHFARAFKQSMGLAPHAYLVKRRVQRVKDLLAGTDLSLTEIAFATGFSDQSHCARRFREHIGVSPSDYRWSMR